MKQTHSGHTLRTRATAIITAVLATVDTGSLTVPRGSLPLSGAYFVSLMPCRPRVLCKITDMLSV